jgi:spectinomycin phosphotransferase
MKVEPDLDRLGLLELLDDRYGFRAAELEFVPRGLGSYAYVATSSEGARVFLKLFDPDRPESTAHPPGFELPLTEALADLGVRVPRPIREAAGRHVSHLDRFDVVVFEHVDGVTLEDEREWPEPLYAAVAATLAAIHASTPRVVPLVERTEQHELPFLATLERAVEQPHPGGLVALPAYELRSRIDRLLAMRDRARAGRGKPVLCHTDFWGSNLILTAQQELYVVDWDGALLGPPEHDLFMFAGTGFFPADRFGWFLDRYTTSFGRLSPNPDLLAFYLYRRNLEDLGDFIAAIVEPGADAREVADAVAFVNGLVAEWPVLDETIEAIAQQPSDADRSRT